MDELRVTYQPDDQWTGKVTVRMVAGQFSGEGSAWINASDIGDFAKAIDGFPMPKPAVFSAGHGGTLDGRRPPETLVRVTIKPLGLRGHLVVSAELQTEVWNDEDAELRQSVVARFTTEYGLLAKFAQSLQNVAAGRVNEAILAGCG